MSKLRELKKYGKKVQVEVQQKRLKEKKDMMDEMKKIRKGQGGNMDFLTVVIPFLIPVKSN